MENNSCKLALLTSFLKLPKTEGFDSYLKEVWIDLIRRETKNENDNNKDNNKDKRQDILGITKLIFTKYYSLPGIIGDRLFRVFDSNNNGVLEYNEFKTGMFNLFCENYEKTLRFIFDFYDFDGEGKISKEDIRIVLLYATYSTKNDKDNEENNKNMYEKKINNILDICFTSKDKEIDYINFTNIVNNKNSDIYFMIYMFLLKKKPFSFKSIELYNKNINNVFNNNNIYINIIENNFSIKDLKDINNNSNIPSSISNNNVKNPINKNLRNKFLNNNNNSLYRSDTNVNSTTYNSKLLLPTNIGSISFKELKLSKNDNNNNYNRRKNFQKTDYFKNLEYSLFNQNLVQTIFEARLPYDICEEIDKVKYNDEDYEEDEEENEIKKIKDNLESEYNNYEGKIFNLKNGKMIKIWFKLFYKDLFYYKNKKDLNHKGMHNLSGLFFQIEATKILDGNKYYSFSITFPTKKRTYFCDNKDEFKNWKKYLRIATNYSNILDIYTITHKIGQGSFSIVKLAINNVTKQKLAVKIMDKKKMSSSRLESARTEIEIMKICQFPYIIKFIEAYENIEFIYIFMEYCEGGTLFHYLKKRDFSIKEELAANIVYKLFLAVYYFHSYGITHRDLKPENILMTNENDDADIRILDFGLGKIIGPNEKCNEPYGTVIYCAPEIILSKPYTKNVDSWSLGIITYIILYGRLPFWHKEKLKLKSYIVKNHPVYKGYGLNSISSEAINFIQNLLIKDQDKRMTISQALEHKWFQKFINKNLVKLKSLNKDKKSVNELFNLLNKVQN